MHTDLSATTIIYIGVDSSGTATSYPVFVCRFPGISHFDVGETGYKDATLNQVQVGNNQAKSKEHTEPQPLLAMQT
jgi:hypothetical protein